jgi:16S rRNA (uracil1498-N3)-methyltransferase
VSAYAAAFAGTAHVFVDGALPDVVQIGGPDGHHLARVRRVRVGEDLTVSNGAGAWRPYRVDAVQDRELALVALDDEQHEPIPTPALAVAFALTKGAKPETVVRQLTELGVDEILPVIAHRSISRPRGERVGILDERLRRVAREAAMQSRRAHLPHIASLTPLAALAGRPGLVLADRVGVAPHELFAPNAHASPDESPVGTGSDPGPDGWTVVVGPEGGFAPEDLAILDGPRVAVGPHVLRAETAAVAAAAVVTAYRT